MLSTSFCTYEESGVSREALMMFWDTYDQGNISNWVRVEFKGGPFLRSEISSTFER